MPHGLLDQVPFQLASTHLLIDPFWSLWITLRYRSWPIQVHVITHYTVSWPTTISDAPLLENGKLYSPGHAKSHQTKHPPYNSVTYDQHWQLVFVLSGTSTWYHQIWSSATLTFPAMSLEYQMTGPSRSFWRNIDLNGASGSTTTSNLLYWYQALNSLLFFDYNVTEFVKESSYLNYIGLNDMRPERKNKLPFSIIYSVFLRDSFHFLIYYFHCLVAILLNFLMSYVMSSWYLPLSIHCFLSCCTSQTFQRSYCCTHGEQTRCSFCWLGMACDFESWNSFCSGSWGNNRRYFLYQPALDTFGIFGTDDGYHWHGSRGSFGDILSLSSHSFPDIWSSTYWCNPLEGFLSVDHLPCNVCLWWGSRSDASVPREMENRLALDAEKCFLCWKWVDFWCWEWVLGVGSESVLEVSWFLMLEVSG